MCEFDSSENLIGDTDNPEIGNFDEIYDKVYKDNIDTLSGKNVNLTYAATEDQLIGNTTRNFSKDYLKNYKLDQTINNTFGIGSNEKLDFNGDGTINSLDMTAAKAAGELDKHEAAKTAFMKRLTNPQTQAEKNVLIGELAEYWTEHNRTAFNNRRAKMGLGDDLFDFPWKKGIALPTTDAGQRDKAFVDSIVNGNETIKHGDNEFVLKNDGFYYQTRGKAYKGEELIMDGQFSKTQLIQSLGGIYKNIPNDFYPGSGVGDFLVTFKTGDVSVEGDIDINTIGITTPQTTTPQTTTPPATTPPTTVPPTTATTWRTNKNIEAKRVDKFNVMGSVGNNKANIFKKDKDGNAKPITVKVGPGKIATVTGVRAVGEKLIVDVEAPFGQGGAKTMGQFLKAGRGSNRGQFQFYPNAEIYDQLKGEDKKDFDAFVLAIETDPAFQLEVMKSVQGDKDFNPADYK